MTKTFYYILLGYLSGSVLYARVFSTLMGKDILARSKDDNPGASNAFQLRGRLPEDKEQLLETLDRIIYEVREEDLRHYRKNLPHL